MTSKKITTHLPQTGWQYIFSIVIMVVVYMMLGFLSGRIFSEDSNLTTVWLPAGMTLAVVLLGGYRYLVGIVPGLLIVAGLRDAPISMSIVLGLSNMITIALSAYILKTRLQVDLTLKTIRDLLNIVIWGGFVPLLLSAVVAIGVFALWGNYSLEPLGLRFLTFWFAPLVGIIFLTPLILSWVTYRPTSESSYKLLESIALVGLTITLNWAVYTDVIQFPAKFYIFYIVILPVIWAILRFGLREVTLVNAITGTFLLWSGQSPTGVISGFTPTDKLIFVWASIGVGFTVVMICRIFLNERNEIVLTMRKERDAMRQILDNLGQGVTVITKDGLYEYVNPAFGKLIGHDHESLIGKSPYEFIADSFKPELDDIFKRRKLGEGHSYNATLKHADGQNVTVMTTGVPRMIDGEHQGSISVLTDIRPLLEAQEARRKIEAEFRDLFENTHIGIYRSDSDGNILAINPILANLLGYDSPEDFLENKPDLASAFYVNEASYEEFQTRLRRDGKVVEFEAEGYNLKTKRKFWAQENAYVVYDDNGEMLYYQGTVTDITVRKQFEQELQRSEAFFRTIFDKTADGIVLVHDNDLVVMSNNAHQRLGGYGDKKIENMTVADYMYPGDYERHRNRFKQALENHEDSYEIELRYGQDESNIRWISATVGIVWNEDDEYEYAIGVCRDITEAREIQQALREDEQRFRAIFENASLPIAVTRHDRFIGMVNPALCEMLGYTEDELMQMQFDDITYPGDNNENLHLHEQLLAGEIESFTVTKRYVHKNGDPIWANVSVSRFHAPIVDADGSNLYTIAIVENITDRKLAEERLFAEMHLTEQLIDALPGVFYFFDDSGKFLRWNKEFEQVTGFTAEQIENVRAVNFFPPEAHGSLKSAIKEVFENGFAVRELPMLNVDGSTTLYLMNGYRLMYNGVPCLLGVGIDISDLKAKEIALRESEERYRAIFENALIGIYRTSAEGRIVNANPAFAQILGYDSVEELYSLDLATDVYVKPADRDEQIRRAIDVYSPFTEHLIEIKKKNGDIIVVGVRAKTYYDDDGNLLFFEGNLRDVTDKYRYDQQLERQVREATKELREKNEQLLELDRLRAKFIADMSHEMRTPLAVLNTRVYLLKNTKDMSNLTRHVDGLQMQIDRLSEFVENAFDLSVLDMSRNNITFDEVALNEIVMQAIQALQPRADVNELMLIFLPDDHIPAIVGVENHLSQVVTNLIGNAIKYTQSGSVTVTTGQDRITNRVYFRVEDTGMGIAPEDIPYLFARFYRGERAGQSTIPGTGLGLSIVKEIIDTHDGHIDVESTINEGSIFTVWLPIKPITQPSIGDGQDDASATAGE